LQEEPLKTDVREEKSGATGIQQQNKRLRLKMAATSEEENDNWQWHQRTKQETGATSENQEGIIWSPQRNSRVGIHKQNSQDFH
jgi:hypothetical protein